MATANITATELRQHLDYDPLTGHFKWICVKVGCGKNKRAGCFDTQTGYVVIKFKRIKYAAHRLAFLWMTGEWPPNTVDHRDRNRSNNVWTNLRHATHKQNQENLPRDPRNKSGHRGVHWCKEARKWCSSIGHKGRKIAIGRSDSKAEAIAMRLEMERKLFTHSEACGTQSANLDQGGDRDRSVAPL